MKKWFSNFLKSIGVGIASSIPGVSGGTIAIVLKIYETIVSAISGILKEFKKNILILLPILLGVLIGLIPTIFLMDYALKGFVFAIVCLFAGFIIGSFPSITDEVKGQKPCKSEIIALFISFLVVIILGVLSVTVGGKINLESYFQNPPVWLYFVLIPVGIIGSAALVIPGISGGTILLILGFYKPLINSFSTWGKELFSGNFSHTGQLFGILGCFAIGVILGFYFISKLMNYLLGKHRRATFYAIIGFIIGSVITLFINNTMFEYFASWAQGKYVAMPMYVEIPIGILLLVAAGIGSYLLVRYQRKLNKEKEKNVTE